MVVGFSFYIYPGTFISDLKTHFQKPNIDCMKTNYLLFFFINIFLLTLLCSFFQNRGGAFLQITIADTSAYPAFTMAKGYEGKNIVIREGLISLTTGVDNEYFLFDSANRRGYLYIETKTEHYSNESVQKAPLNISIVIDRSGSMAGEKMEFAKKAANGIIDKLSSEDFVSVVIYDEFIDVIQEATPVLYKDSIKKKIAKVKPRGSTNVWGGSERGYEQVKRNFKNNYINRVLLISDGNITAGIKIPSRILEKVQEYKDIEGITISTFGVGLDYNETLMTDMAENGAGNYYFINRADKMEAMFKKELDGLLNLVAKDAELRITLPKGVVVEKVYPFKFAQVKNEVIIKFRDLFSEEEKGLVLQFRLEDKVDKEFRIMATLTYTDAINHQPKLVSNESVLQPVKSMETYLTHFNKAVAEKVVIFTANENLEKAMLEVDRGNYEAARRYAEANGYIFDKNASYVSLSGELQKMDSVNRFYAAELVNAKSMSKDSLKLLQKSNKALNYQIRNKRQE